MDVASQALKDFETESPQPFLLRDVLPGPAWAPYRAAARALPRVVDDAVGASEHEGSAVRGLLVGLGLEGAAAMGIFGLWQLWHLIR